MAVQLIIGSSGSGKTTYLFQKIVEEAKANRDKNYLVIVPEQFTLHTQQTLVELSDGKAIMNIDVLSFKRLAFRVFEETGIQNLQILEETGKNLVLRKIAQEKEKELTVMRPNIGKIGYISEIKSMISELMQYNISSEALRTFSEKGQLSKQLSYKLQDIVTMYEGFEQFLKGSFVTAEEILHVLARVAHKSQILKHAVLAFDEFTGFTPVQNELLQVLMPLVEKIYITVAMDAREQLYSAAQEFELFSMPKKTIRSILDIAERAHQPVEEPVLLKDAAQKRFVHAPALAFMEQHLFRSKLQSFSKEASELVLTSCKNPKDELLLTARRIAKLVRTEGYRYKDIAVVTGAVENYANYAKEVFGKYDIPCFVDQTMDILFHPFIEFIRASLEVLHRDFSYESITRYIKCGFSGLSDDQMDQLDNYLIATGIRGKKQWGTRWLRKTRKPELFDLEQLEETRKTVYEQFRPLLEVAKSKGSTVKDMFVALYGFFCEREVEKMLYEKSQALLEKGAQAEALVYEQIYGIIMDLFDKYVQILGEERLELVSFMEILDAGFDGASVATLPPGYDCVTLGDIERTRLNQNKVLFFVGVLDGIIPKAEGSGGLISEYERQLLQNQELSLAPGAREKNFIQRYYLYLNLTKPSDRLYISYSRVDAMGKATRPSYLVGTLRRMFPKVQEEYVEEVRSEYDASTKQSALDYIIFGEQEERWMLLAKSLADTPEFAQWLEAHYYQHSDDPISKAIARVLYGDELSGSVTRLEKYAACAYAHFLQYGLRLSERETHGFASVDMGTIYHAALQKYSIQLAKSEADWFTVTEEQQSELCNKAIREAIEEYPGLLAYATGGERHLLRRMEEIFRRTVWALTKQVRKGRFVPEKFEISFADCGGKKAFSFSLGSHQDLTLLGRVDRMDGYHSREEGITSVKVIDYKTGNTQFDLLKIYQGTQLQLVVYLNVAMELSQREHPNTDITPGGIFYYHIDDPVIETNQELSEEELYEALLQKLKPDGLVNEEESIYRAMDQEFEKKSDVIPVTIKKDGTISQSQSKTASSTEFDTIQKYVRSFMKRSGRQILDGDIRVNPYVGGKESSCTYCPYSSVCGMDTKISGYSVRPVEVLEKDEIIEKMQTSNALEEAKEQEEGEKKWE